MSEENKTVELKEEELEKVSGGLGPESTPPPILFSEYIYYCPSCKNGIIDRSESDGIMTNSGLCYCLHCKMWVTPVEK